MQFGEAGEISMSQIKKVFLRNAVLSFIFKIFRTVLGSY